MGIDIPGKDKEEMLTALSLFKADLGVRNESRDDYFTVQLLAARTELTGKGIKFDTASLDDHMLLADYAAWRYRMRLEDSPAMSEGLRYRLRNRMVQGRAADAEQTETVS